MDPSRAGICWSSTPTRSRCHRRRLRATSEQFARLQEIYFRGRLIAKKLVNPADYIISVPDFFQKANTFDHDGVVAQAKGCDVKM